ncbi:hypothetical protein [Affinirhizobium pseudoryzae]|uniref:hypothetical protein n=1 Tax=Allorhizobium pseudoryzae TaxID=379684 RepID=UPI0013EA8F00|nr:hypothetical protein [Allorhizobium pseudoryzae]
MKYLRISHPEKIKFDLVFPVVFACFFFLPVFSSQFREDALKGIDVLGRSSDLLSILTGFFVASLAAVATFGGDEMNQPMPGSSPMLLKHSGSAPPEELTRRRFLCFLFGYLAFTSLGIYLGGFAYFAVQAYILEKYWPDSVIYSFVVFWGLYGLALGNLLSNTLLGLFYLTDRIHRPNHIVRWKVNRPEDDGKTPSKVA